MVILCRLTRMGALRKLARPMRLLVLLTAGTVVASGCHRYTYTSIKPPELPRLTGPTTGVTSDGTAVAVATRVVERPDGRIVEIHGRFDVVMDMGRGDITLVGPVHATLDGDRLLVKSANRSPIETPLADVRTVQVKQYDVTYYYWSSAAWSTVIALVAGVGAAILAK
jgi:hypothetical protein